MLHAAAGGHGLAVARLLGAGANKEKRKLTGATPLLAAAMNGHTEVVALLLAAAWAMHSGVRVVTP